MINSRKCSHMHQCKPMYSAFAVSPIPKVYDECGPDFEMHACEGPITFPAREPSLRT
jgi:hypothetical protein